MKQQTFNISVGILFSIVGLLHLLRVLLGWDLTVNKWLVPVWVSVVAVILIGYLALAAFQKKK